MHNTIEFICVIISALIAVVGVIISIHKWMYSKRIPFSIKIMYLIPQSKYNGKQYNGFPEKEQKKSKLTIGIGKYQLYILHQHKIALTQVYPPIVNFDGDSENKPTKLLLDKHPFIVDERINTKGEKVAVAWHGNSIPNEQCGKYLPYSDGLIVKNIETYGYWKGKITITFRVEENTKPIVVKLPLSVSKYESEDEVPFLKII